MNVLGKIIAVIAFVLIILILVNYRSILPLFDNLAFGGGSKTPFQISASYIEQANQLSPYSNMTGTSSTAVTYGDFLEQQRSAKNPAKTTIVKRGSITVIKQDALLTLTTENLKLPNSNPKVHIWLTNTPTITDDTRYIDFGLMRSGSPQTYSKTLGDPNVSLVEYKHVMIIDTTTYAIYAQSVLSK
ncbi:MAG: hypothetical protein V4686_00645 [Patescibacteria group bacterium]